ncbi:sensitivity to high expression protein she9 [Actinomortierella ambigua]|uniref:Sensitive to high expression protein 9, mitochondrial n=1 Tax=Actinomortierella ambigua TaxID=1343610 RepID=A0A9P6UAL5_9FUNG|nr:sensitivity to high expression protein she9 [Actinomortierella ambigua]
MLAHHARIVPARSSVLVSSLLHHAAAPGCTSLVHRPLSTTCIRQNKQDGGSSNSSGANGKDLTTPPSTTPNHRRADTNTTSTTTSSSGVVSATAKSEPTTATDLEKKRAEERDATLKEILESAAAEARSLERERLAEEARRQEALKAAAAAERARQEELERLQTAAAVEPAVPQKESATTKSASEAPSSSSFAATSSPSSLSSSTTHAAQPEPLPSEKASRASISSSSTAVDGGNSSTTATPLSSSPTTVSHDPLDDFKARLLPYKKSLQSSTEYLISSIPDSLRELSDSIKRRDYQDMISQLAKHLNTITGYNAIDKLKRQVISHGDALDTSRIKLAQAKHAYEEAIATRSNTQKAINDLLQRKHLWSPNDVIRFTDLYRSEHANEQAEIRTKEAYRHAEEEVEEKSRKLTTIIMERYHGEQVWSDKIRAASTYGTWGLVCVNVMAFLVVQAFVEPRRRRKQIERYEELVQDLTDRGILPGHEGGVGGGVATAYPSQGAAGTASTSGATALPADFMAATTATLVNPGGEEDGQQQQQQTATFRPAAAAQSLDGGIDILERLVQLAQEQEARLTRMEAIMTGQDASPPAIAGAFSETERVSMVMDGDAAAAAGANEVVMTDDGTILLVHYGDGLEAEVASQSTTGLDAETWPDQLAAAALGRSALRHARLGPSLSSSSTEDDRRAWTERVKGMLASNDDPVLMKKCDYWLSGLGGAILGSIVTGLIIMASNR